jgi:hypothetical protein
MRRRYRSTGPDADTRATILVRSGGVCEWPSCMDRATDLHHRLNRKMGGRKGGRADQLNGAAWLLHACRYHHDRVTSATGDQLKEAKDYGWVLLEHEDAEQVLVAMFGGLFMLGNDGGKVPFDAA